MAISAQAVKQLKELTNCGMMDCKRALEETNGDVDAAIKNLREKGLAKAAKKSGRIAAEGDVYKRQAYICPYVLVAPYIFVCNIAHSPFPFVL